MSRCHGNETLNAKLIETAHLVLQKYTGKIRDAAELEAAVQQWRKENGQPSLRPTLGEAGRPAGGLSLRTALKADGSPAAQFAAAAAQAQGDATEDAPA